MLADARLVAAKDLRLELRSRVVTNQVVPLALLILVLFAFALDPDRGLLGRVTAGLYWVAVLLATVLAVQRAFGVESPPGVRDALRLSGLEPVGIFLGKVAALGAQLLALEVVLGAGVVVLYGTELKGLGLLVVAALAATVALASAGSLYGALAAGTRVRETLLPLLFLPVTAPVLIAATQAWEGAIEGTPGEGWPWCGFLAAVAAVQTVVGALAFGPLLEDT